MNNLFKIKDLSKIRTRKDKRFKSHENNNLWKIKDL